MIRFAVVVTVVMVVLTAGAAVWVALAEAPVAIDYLTSQNLSDIGARPSSFRSQRMFLPDGVTWCKYHAEVNDATAMLEADVRMGESRARFDEAVARETQNEKKKMEPGCTFRVEREKYGREKEVDVLVTLRAYELERGSYVAAEVWMQEGTSHFHARITSSDVPKEWFERRRDWCRRQAVNVAQVMLGAVREEREKKN